MCGVNKPSTEGRACSKILRACRVPPFALHCQFGHRPTAAVAAAPAPAPAPAAATGRAASRGRCRNHTVIATAVVYPFKDYPVTSPPMWSYLAYGLIPL